ncbi:MAG TPA: nuclear transport factor 2 family protein [Thermoleophilaceae bacterium]|jgi:ketosteroid isomerase-like protein
MREAFDQVGQIETPEARLDYWYEHLWAEDIDYRAIEGALDDNGPIIGRDAMRRYVADWVETLDDFDFTPEEIIDAGDGVFVAVIRFSGRVRGSENTVQQHMAVVWTFRDGKMVRGREYSTRDEALRAAGLSGE